MARWLSIFIIVAVLIGGVVFFISNNNKELVSNETQDDPSNIRYVALGDSYTIGEGLKDSERWPNQLVKILGSEQINVSLVANPSRTGYTTQDLIEKEIPVLGQSNAEFVTLQIGVNDYFQGVTKEVFEQQFTKVLNAITKIAPEAKLLVVTIPDYGQTPAGARYGKPEVIATGIAEYNAIITKLCIERAVPLADVYKISQESSASGKLVSDGLHPSGEQYTDWLQTIVPATEALLKN